MTTTDEDNAADQRLTFGRYRLDLRRGVLLRDGREIALRPETFAVLRYLVEHPDRPVSRETLLEAVWPNVIVSDDLVVQCVGELRRELGEAGPRMIVTVPQGYRFDANEAPPDRRKQRHGHLLRWRWTYGILAPLALLLTFVVLWLSMRGCAA